MGGKPIAGKDRTLDSARDRQRWFYILLFIGIAICLPKLFKLTGTQKYGYRDAARWLNKNTAPSDVIAVPDKRITFYAERNGIEYSEKKKTSTPADYYVSIINSADVKPEIDKNIKQEYSTWVNSDKQSKLVICKVIR